MNATIFLYEKCSVSMCRKQNLSIDEPKMFYYVWSFSYSYTSFCISNDHGMLSFSIFLILTQLYGKESIE